MTRITAKPAEQFLLQVRDAGLPEPEREFYFAKHLRRSSTGRPYMYRFDFAWPEAMIAIEVEGGVFMRGKGGHTSITGITRDMDKINLAQLLGWRVLRFHTKHIDEDEAVPMVMQLLRGEAA